MNLIAIGLGPSNLSLSALLTPINMEYLFLEQKNKFQWHEDSLFKQSLLQTHYLKDCVTLVDPTNSFSFLNFLAQKKRLYQFLNKKDPTVSRNEFNQYYQWVSETVESVIYKDDVFEIKSTSGNFISKNLVIGTGQIPYVPVKFTGLLSERICHSYYYKKNKDFLYNSLPCSVAVIGGGQSGAEIIEQLLSSDILPSNIVWGSKRLNFHPLEDSCFANEFYTPDFRKKMLKDEKRGYGGAIELGNDFSRRFVVPSK